MTLPPRARRIVLTAAAALAGSAALLYAVAWLLIPRDWVERQARRQAGQIRGATVRWERLSTGLSRFTLGARLTGVSLRMPAEGEGEARVEARAREVFIRFRLLPLLVRRVEVEAARVSGAGIALHDPGEGPPGVDEEEEERRPRFRFHVPRLEIEDVDVRTRDRFGSGIDLRRVSGHADLEGTLDRPRAIQVEARAESLFWKPLAQGKAISLPSPLELDAGVASRDNGRRFEFRSGKVSLGPLESDLRGEIRTGSAPGSKTRLALLLLGKPQRIDSKDEAFRGVAARIPAKWSATTSWRVQVTGDAASPTQMGRITFQPVSIESGKNRFGLERLIATWNTFQGKTYTARADGAGSGVTLTLDARGSTAPGGSSRGTLVLRAPATRLNGLVRSMPNWSSGHVECRAVVSLDPPASPSLRWFVRGAGLSGTAEGLRRPISRLQFDLEGDSRVVTIRSLDATVGSTTGSLTGTVRQGKPLGTGSFRAILDRFVAEEWTRPPRAGGRSSEGSGGVGTKIPLESFDATVSIGEVRSGRMILRDVVAPVSYDKGRLRAAPIRGTLGAGTIAGELDVKDFTNAPSYTLDVEVKRVPVQEFVTGVLPMKLGLVGFANGTVKLAGPGLPGLTGNSISGSLRGTVEEGRILETPAIAQLRSALGAAVGAETASEVAFKTLTYAARVERGRLVVEKVRGEVGKDLLEMTGSAGFDRTLDLNLLLALFPQRVREGTFLATLARYARDAEGRIPVTVKLTGTASAPRLSIKPAGTLRAAGEKLQQELLKRITRRARADTSRADTTAATAGADTSRARTDSLPVGPQPSRTDSAEADAIRKAREALERLLGR